MTETLVRITAPHFVAGLVLVNNRCIEAAPILKRWAMGRDSDTLRGYIAKHGWKATIVRRSGTGAAAQ